MAAVWISAHVLDNADTDDHDTAHDQGLADLVADLDIPDWHADEERRFVWLAARACRRWSDARHGYGR